MRLGNLKLYGLADIAIFSESCPLSLDGGDDDTFLMAPSLGVFNALVKRADHL